MGKPGKYFRLFFSDPALRRRVWNRYVHHRNIYAKGESEIGFLRNAVFGFQSFMVAWLFMKSLIPWLPTWVMFAAFPCLIAVKFVTYYTVGKLWDREKIFKLEKTWSNERDPMAETISERLLSGSGLEVK